MTDRTFDVLDLVPRVRRFARRVREDNVSAFAAQSAFFALLSLVPFVMLLLSVMGPELPADTLDLLPPLLADLLPSLTGTTGTLTPLSAVTALWAVSRGTAAVIGGLTRILGLQEGAGFLRTRVSALLYTLAFLFLVVLSLFLLLFGGGANRFLQELFPRGSWLWLVDLRSLLAVALLTGLFLLMYRYLPAGRAFLSFRALLPGAAVTALSWTVFSRVFSYYAAEVADYTRLYGGLAAVAMAMLWLYVCMYLLFLGAELNLALSRG